jgi:hypothetical protein
MVSYQSVVVLDNKKTMVLQTVAELGMVVFDNKRTSYRRCRIRVWSSLIIRELPVQQTVSYQDLVVFDNRKTGIADGGRVGIGRLL